MNICAYKTKDESTKWIRTNDINKLRTNWMNEWTNWMNEWTNEYMNEWMNEWMNERTNEWMNEWMNE